MPGGPTAFSRAPVAAVGRGIRNRAAPRERRPPGAGKSGLPGERLSRTFLGPAPVGAGRGEAISAVRSRAAPRERRPPGAGKPRLPRERLLRTSPGPALAGAGREEAISAVRSRAAPRERRPPGAGKPGLPRERLSRTSPGPALAGGGRGEAISAVRSRAAPRERRPPGAGKPGLPWEWLRTSPGAGAGGRRPRGGDQRGPKQSGAAGAASSRSRETGAARGAVVARFHRGRCWRAPAAGRRSAQSEAERRRRSGALQESGNRGCHGLHWPPSAANIVSTGTA